MNHKPCIFYIVNGADFFLSHRLPLALAMKEKGNEVYVLCKDTGQSAIIKQYGLHFINIAFERSGTNPFKDTRIIFQIKKLIQDYQPEIIHNVTIKPAIYGSIAARYARVDTIVINAISGLGYNFIEGRNNPLQKFLKQLMAFAFQSGVAFIFQNSEDCAIYQKNGFLQKNVYKIIKGAGVDGSVFTFSPPEEKHVLHVVVTARMLYDKGIMEFIEAAELLSDKWRGKAKFILAGGIDEANKSSISQNDLEKRLQSDYIEWIGFQNDVLPLLKQSDIVCLLSYREGLPKSLIEAMAIGRPIVTTNVPGCKECVVDNVNGFLVPAKEATAAAGVLNTLLTNADLRLKMGKASRLKMENELSLKKVVKETIDWYHKAKENLKETLSTK